MKKVIVTGANGLIGTSILKELSKKGTEVFAIIKDENENIQNIKELHGVKIVYCELDQINELEELILDRDIDTCIHLAWIGASGINRSKADLQLSNIGYALELVKTISNMKVKRFVGAGTLMEIDTWNYIPQDGSTPNAISHYPAAKIATRMMTKIECNNLGIEHLWCQISNTYGPHIKQGFIHYLLDSLMNSQNTKLTEGLQLYDFMFIDDTVSAFIKVAEKGENNNTYYLGSSNPRQLRDYIYIIRDLINKQNELNLGAVPYKGTFLEHKDYDCTNLLNHTGFQCKYSFDVGIKKTIEWMRHGEE